MAPPHNLAQALAQLDAQLHSILGRGVIRLLSVRALLAKPPGKILRLQDLLQSNASLFLSPHEAARLLATAKRRILVLSHCWPTRESPDPDATKLSTVIEAVKKLVGDAKDGDDFGLFWEYAACDQIEPDYRCAL